VKFLGDLLLIVVILGGSALLLLAAGILVARHFLRRRWRSVKSHPATLGVLATASLVTAWRERAGARVPPEALSLGTASRVRRRMWVAIEDAEEAVQHADAVNAPVAELPSVCRSLRVVGTELDGLLRLERRLPRDQGRPDNVRAQVAELITAAREVQLAALRSGGDATEPQLRALVRDARDEVDIVASALARLRSVTPHQP
jgi:hypothetical protein